MTIKIVFHTTLSLAIGERWLHRFSSNAVREMVGP